MLASARGKKESGVTMTPSLSVIIPCHSNAYFRECLQSLADQTDHDFTTIVVFDKCEDDSPKIAQEFKDRLNLKMYVTSGGKPSVPRNAGMNCCTTDYFTFLDSDDEYCDKEAVEKLRAAATSGVNAFRHKVTGDNGESVRAFCFSWTINTAFANSHNVRFDERLTYMEDLKFEMYIRFVDPEFRHYPFGFQQLDETLVHHRDNERSICHDVARRIETEYKDYNSVFTDLAAMNLSEEQKDFLALVYLQTTFRIFAERSAVKHIPFDSLVKRAMPLIRQYTLGRNQRGRLFDYYGKKIPLWSLLKLDCDRKIMPSEQQDKLMAVLIKMALR